MPISFANISKGATYSRQVLAELWGYASFHAIARGVVTPRGDNKIVLFVTEEKQPSAEQYDIMEQPPQLIESCTYRAHGWCQRLKMTAKLAISASRA
jgi:hypothetical protein